MRELSPQEVADWVAGHSGTDWRASAHRCWADPSGHKNTEGCTHVATTAIGLCADHYDEILGR